MLPGMTEGSGPIRATAQAIRGYGRFAALAFRAGPGLMIVTTLSTLVAAVAPLGTVAAIGAVVGLVPDVIDAGIDSPAGEAATRWAAAVGALFVVQWAASAIRATAASALGDRVDFTLQRDLMDSVMGPVGLDHLEDPGTRDLVDAGRETFRAWQRPGRLAANLSDLASARCLLLGSCVMLVGFRWPLAFGLAAVALWTEREARLSTRRAAEHHHGESELARRTEYYYELGVTPDAAKEVRVFGLADFLVERFGTTWRQATALVFAKESRRSMAATVALGLLVLGALTWVCADAFRGAVSLDAAVVYAQAIVVGLGAVSASADARVQTELAMTTMERYELALRRLEPSAAGAAQPAPVHVTPSAAGPDPGPAALPTGEIRFDSVRFRYAGTGVDVLSGLDLVIPAGQSLAVVGANGAGKTTLVKLLCRLHEPTSGRITADGIDLAELDPRLWRRRIAAVFQDYVRFEMTAGTNVGLGFAAAQDDLAGIRAAAGVAGVADVVEQLPNGWDTVLSRDYAGGTELSGGEWQKVALARALFAVQHGAGLLVLDEPAAHLDARAEARLYEQFLTMTAGLTTVVISHRFSTVRQAASIAVLQGGRVAEQGSHDELIAQGGHYARMFQLQAARFTEAVGK